jgi:exopolysaccharide production protein ExoY
MTERRSDFAYPPPMASATRPRILPFLRSGPGPSAEPVAAVRVPSPRRVTEWARRGVDIVIAATMLLLTAPVILLLALVVRVTSPGPAFFRQVRVGSAGRPFRIVKLRTMVRDAEDRLRRDPGLRHEYVASHFKVPADLDPRLTAVGRFLRRTSLDELPQLVNVLLGHMSMVGPRPVVPEELSLYGELSDAYVSVRPGITGYWQVCGRSHVTGPDRLELDRYYIENRNLLFDLKILARTVPAVLRCRGAH